MDGEILEEHPVKKALFTVTPLSKYLAMMLFVALPFLGGLVAYTMISPQVITISNDIPTPKSILTQESKQHSKSTSAKTVHSIAEVSYFTVQYDIDSNSELYTDIMNQVSSIFSSEFPDTNNLKDLPEEPNVSIVRVSDEKFKVHVILTTSGYSHPSKFFVFERNTDSDSLTLISTLDDRLNDAMPEQWISTTSESLLQEYRLIRIEGSENSYGHPDSLVMYDFETNTRNVLYKEADANVQIAAGCEWGCGAPLYATRNSVLFCRYERINGSYGETKFIECREINVPQ